MAKADRHTGSRFESFLEEEGIREDVEAVAIKRVFAWQLKQAMDKRHISKKAMAERLHTSRTQVERLLNPENVNVQLGTLTKAAHEVGLRFIDSAKQASGRVQMRPAPRAASRPTRAFRKRA